MVNWYTCRKRFSIDSRFFLCFHVLVVDEYKKFEVSAWILDCTTSNLMTSDTAVENQFSWLSEDFLKGTVQSYFKVYRQESFFLCYPLRTKKSICEPVAIAAVSCLVFSCTQPV